MVYTCTGKSFAVPDLQSDRSVLQLVELQSTAGQRERIRMSALFLTGSARDRGTTIGNAVLTPAAGGSNQLSGQLAAKLAITPLVNDRSGGGTTSTFSVAVNTNTDASSAFILPQCTTTCTVRVAAFAVPSIVLQSRDFAGLVHGRRAPGLDHQQRLHLQRNRLHDFGDRRHLHELHDYARVRLALYHSRLV